MLCDYHTHTYYSFDSDTEPEKLCAEAYNNGVTSLAITDHLDIDCEDCGLSYEIDHNKRKNEILDLKDKYKGKLDVIYGIELGQMQNRPEEAKELIKNGGFEFIIGSIHNLRYVPDFYYFDFRKMEPELIKNLISRYLDATLEMLDFDGIDTVGHITYPLRYAKQAGVDVDITCFYSQYEQIFKKAMDKGIAIEVNTSTLYKGPGFTMPGKDILKLYKDIGGKLITVGSDAHQAENVGKGVKEAYELLTGIGFDRVTIIKNKEKIQVKI